MNVNSRSMFYVIREVAVVMKTQQSKVIKGRNGERDVGKGSIVNMSSALAYGAVPGKIGYIASKHAVLGITKSAGRFKCLPVLLIWLTVFKRLKMQALAFESTCCHRPGRAQLCTQKSWREHHRPRTSSELLYLVGGQLFPKKWQRQLYFFVAPLQATSLESDCSLTLA